MASDVDAERALRAGRTVLCPPPLVLNASDQGLANARCIAPPNLEDAPDVGENP